MIPMLDASPRQELQHQQHEHQHLAFAAGGGDMGALLRAFDWGATPLGPLDGWPQSLRTAVSILLGAQHPMYVAWGPQLHLLYNDGYRQLLGARAAHPERILGQPFRVVWAEAWEQVRPALDDALRGVPTYAEDRAFTVERNGYPETMYATFSSSPIRDESGAVAGVLCVCSETTAKVVSQRERDAALAELATSNEKLTLAADAAEFGLFDHTLPRKGIAWNARAREHFGMPAEGPVTSEMIERALHPDDRERVLAAVRALVAAPAGEQRYQDEYRTVGLADGRERWILARGRVLPGADGRPARLVGTTMDISGHKQAEGSARASAQEALAAAERLRLLDAIGEATRVAHDPAAIMGEATRLLGRQMGVTRVAYADLEADNDRFTIRHDWTAPGAASTVGVYSLDLFGARARTAMRAGRTLLIHDVDAELGEADGAAMFNRIGVKAIICCPLVKGGRLVAMMAVHQDAPRRWTAGEVALVEAVVERCWAHIERVRGAEALRDADRRKSEFLATLAHELRNPLAPIRNGLELMRMQSAGKPVGKSVGNAAGRTADPALLDNVRAMMERQVNHMVHLVNDLLDIARVSSGKLVLQMRRVDLREAIATAVETSRPLIDANGHRLEVDVPDLALEVEADPVRISQVVSNLLSNAAKYTPHGGRIVLAARIEGALLAISVQDNGIGIGAESLGAVFDMFTQVERSLTRSNGGLGIGLSLVRRLVELHGGSVLAASDGVGRGSTFTVRLTLAAGAPQGPDLVHGDTVLALGQAGRRLRVLVADDNADAAHTLAALLEIAGHETRVVHDGVAALAVASQFAPQLVFLDIGMPRLDGYETARRLRASPESEGAMLVALTGWGAEEDRARSSAAGFDRHLLKPALPADVEAVLAEALARP
jgi:PAS domain S-box-containing protein